VAATQSWPGSKADRRNVPDRKRLTPAELATGLQALADGWSGDTDAITRTVQFPSFLAAVEFISRLAPVAEALDHHPDLSLSWRTVTLTLSTHSSGGVTAMDLDLAAQLDQLIAGLAGS
jgi:4a-hydroxytetrahydrobiopterin dehydratase